MPIDDDDDNEDFLDFDNDDLSEEEKAEIERAWKEKDKKRKDHPLFKKAKDIFVTVNAIVERMSEEEKEMQGRSIIESAMMLAPKLAGAMGSDSWLICMQNGAIIREHAAHLLVSVHSLREFTSTEEGYVKVLRKDMEEFRTLFNEWMIEVHAMADDDFDDEWGLFLHRHIGN
jgi:hypothetical protein